jgi:hypothetical protein
VTINTHDVQRLRAAFDTIPEPTRPKDLIGAAFETFDGTKIPIHGVPLVLRLGPFRRWWERRITQQLIDLGAWQWLRPDQPGQAHQLEKLRKWLGLTTLDHGTFCSQLADACIAIANEQPDLDRFIRKQVAEAEFGVTPAPVLSEALIRGFEEFQSHLLLAALTRDTDEATEVANGALLLAARIVRDVLISEGSRECRFDVNLMVPFHSIDAFRNKPGAAAARELWAECDEHPHQYFVVVQSVGAQKYLGFWIPDVRPDGRPLPGAPSAFYLGRAQAVHLDDLPPLPVRNEVTRARWKEYLTSGSPNGFSGSLFISVPVLGNVAGSGERPVVGVVNVNIHDDQAWPRAYSPSWLDRAGRLASSYVTTAWHAFILAQVVGAATQTEPSARPLPATIPPAFARHLLTPAPSSIELASSESGRGAKDG